MSRELDELVKSAKLVGIDVVKYRWERGHPVVAGPLKLPPTLNTTIEIRVAVPTELPPESASFLCIALVKLTDPDNAELVLGVVEIQVRVAYTLEGVTPPLTPEEGKQFGEVLAMHQAWPFLRERLRTASSELGLNPIVLPLNKAGLEAKEQAARNGQSQAATKPRARKPAKPREKAKRTAVAKEMGKRRAKTKKTQK